MPENTVVRNETNSDLKHLDGSVGESDSVKDECGECGGSIIEDESRGEVVCVDCGLVVSEDEIDHGPEWRSFRSDSGKNATRVGSPMDKSQHDKGLATDISPNNRDGYGNVLSPKARRKFKRLRTWNSRYQAKDHKERNLRIGFGEIDRMRSALGLSDTIGDTACDLFRQCMQQNMLLGHSIEGYATACLYASVRIHQKPRQLKEFYTVSRIVDDQGNNCKSLSNIPTLYKKIMREFGLKIPPEDPIQYANRFMSELEFANETDVRNDVRELYEIAKTNNLHSGKNPAALAVGIIYCASCINNESVTQADLSEIAGLSHVTIRDRFHELRNAAGFGDEKLWKDGKYEIPPQN